jgi:hypothetical protein
MEHVCKCPNAMFPADRKDDHHLWFDAVIGNRDRAMNSTSSSSNTSTKQLDVVFYGDSITEGWLGTSLGQPRLYREKNKLIFNTLFTLDGGGKYNAMALGMSGDLVSVLILNSSICIMNRFIATG